MVGALGGSHEGEGGLLEGVAVQEVVGFGALRRGRLAVASMSLGEQGGGPMSTGPAPAGGASWSWPAPWG